MESSHIFTVVAIICKETSYYSHSADMISVKDLQLIIIKYTMPDFLIFLTLKIRRIIL
jgi:hypothetical protein